MNWLALDIGGANIKSADGRQFAQSYAFPLWRQKDQLAAKLRAVIAEAPFSDHLAVTMTGELADCFASRAIGVQHILRAVEEASDGRHTRFYLVDGRLVAPRIAAATPLLAASANWHALARFCCRLVDDATAVIIDIGSTTVDIVPLAQGRVASQCTTDFNRLQCGQLVYTGLERSPVCAVVDSLPWKGRELPIAQEVFATMRDVHLLLGNVPEAENDCNTADGQPATCDAAHRRLARLLCADSDQFSRDEVTHWARAIAARQMALLVAAARQVMGGCSTPPTVVVVAGHGESIIRQLVQQIGWPCELVSLHEQLTASVSRCAPAHALAVLAAEQGCSDE